MPHGTEHVTRYPVPLLSPSFVCIFVARLGEVFAHRKALEFVPHIDAPEERMPRELHPIQVERFAFLQIRAGPLAGQGWNDGTLARNTHTHGLGAATRDAEEVVDYFDQPVEDVVDSRDVGKILVAMNVAQIGGDTWHTVRVDHDIIILEP